MDGKYVMEIGNYYMRPVFPDDLEMILRWRNSDRVRNAMLNSHIISKEEHLKWYDRIKNEPVKRAFVFCYRERPIGYIGYTELDLERKCCSPGEYLGVFDDIPSNAGFSIIYFANEYAYAKMGMKETESSILSDNIKSLAVNKLFRVKILEGSEQYNNCDGRKKVVRTYMNKEIWNKAKKRFEHWVG